MKKVLMVLGSLRKNSFNHQLAMAVKPLLEEKAEVTVLEYAELPFLNQDFEFPAPKPVADARRAVLEADGLWIFSPEYNGQIPGVLKNLLDWLSRPMDPADRKRATAVRGKPVTVSSTAGRSAGAGVRMHLSSLLEAMAMTVVGGTGTGVALDADAFQTETLTLSEQNRRELAAQAALLLAAL